MATAQTNVGPDTPMGATLAGLGATFRVWAPRARHVYVVLDPGPTYLPAAADELVAGPSPGHWAGYVEGVADGTPYQFYLVGPGGEAFRRDPWAREIGGSFPDYVGVVRSRDGYPWHDAGFRPPPFSDLTVYQFHVGVFSARDGLGNDRRPGRVAKLLDVLERVPYLTELGVRAVQPLPVVEFRSPSSLGYNGSDLYSPETDYCVPAGELGPYLGRLNALLAAKGHPPLQPAQLTGHVNQLKAFVDVFHLYGIAVILDVVYNHAGDGTALWYFDLPASQGPDDNAYFGTGNWTGPVFKFRDPDVAQFLISNGVMFLTEYHADGLRFDEVTVIDRFGGWSFAQDLTSTLHWVKPEAFLLAEFWAGDRAPAVRPPPTGMGFDAGYADRVRTGVRTALTEAAGGAEAFVNMAALARSLEPPGLPDAWRAYNYLENHDLLWDDPSEGHRQPRVVTLAGGRASGWYARSRARVGTGLLLTAPGIPALFMGQEFLEDKWWSDSPNRPDRLIWWAGAEGGDPQMVDFLGCTRALLRLRDRLPALRSEGVHVYHDNSLDRILAFHRWVPGVGADVVVVASLRETPFEFGSYQLGFPAAGRWVEAFNSDAHDGPGFVQGNGGAVTADGPPLHDLPASAGITIPANALLVFTRP